MKRFFTVLIALFIFCAFTSCNIESSSSSTADAEITALKFPYSVETDIEINVKQSYKSYVSVRGVTTVAHDDVIFVSTNAGVATVEYDYTAQNTFLYFKITGISSGETDIYVQSSDGKVKSECIHVKVIDDPTHTEPDSSDTVDLTKFIVNTSSKKFHFPDCYHAKKILGGKNAKEFAGGREELIARGYEPCKACNP